MGAAAGLSSWPVTGGYLAASALLQYGPQRRPGPIGETPPLGDYRLGLAFMAAAPRGVSELDYEAKEAAILDAGGREQRGHGPGAAAR